MKRKTVFMIGAVTLGHCAAMVFALSFFGCGLTREPPGRPPSPIMPPPARLRTRPEVSHVPTFVAEPAPAMMDTEPTTSYVVRAGDTLSQVARRYDVKMSDLVRINTISNPNALRVGQTLLLPGHVQVAPATAEAANEGPAPGGQLRYTVEPGDCLSKIAAAYGTTVRAIQRANGLTSDRIRIGQALIVPGSPGPETANVPASVESALVPDDPVPAGQDWVGGSEPNDQLPSFDPLQPATELPDLPAPESMEEAETPTSPAHAEEARELRWHTAGSGEDLDTIAEMYPGVLADDIMRLNGMKSTTVVPGQRLRIPFTGE